MSEVETALIVAGGRGTRLQPLTYDVRKELIPFCGAPFLEGVIRRLTAAGVRRVLLVVGADASAFDVLDPVAAELGIAIDAVPEPEPLDTAGGVRSVADELDGPVLVLNGDILTDVDYAAVGRAHIERGADTTIVLTEVEDTSSYGVAVREGTRIVEFVEKPAPGTLPGQTMVNAGTYVLDPAVLLDFPYGRLSFEKEVFPGVLERGGRIEGFVWDGVWADLGTPDRYRTGHRIALRGELRWPGLDAVPEGALGVRVAPGAEVDEAAAIGAPALVLGGARVEAGARVGPFAVVGEGAVVEKGAEVGEDAILHDRVVIGAGVRALGLVAGAGARVESGVTLGRKVVLGAGEVVRAGEEVADAIRRPPARDLQ